MSVQSIVTQNLLGAYIRNCDFLLLVTVSPCDRAVAVADLFSGSVVFVSAV